jgi:endonuclease-3
MFLIFISNSYYMPKTDWSTALKPLIKQYKGKPHPLEYKNIYQLLVMVILSAQDSDKHINQLAPTFFKAFPNMKALAKADEALIHKFIAKVRNSANKSKWLAKLAQTIKDDKNIPLTMEELVELPGIGRKSANVIMREAKVKAEGVMVDLHVVRVAPRIGITTATDPKLIEKQIMEAMSRKDWGEIGMAISFLGREVCRPSHPKHHECVVQKYCSYYKATHAPGKGSVKTASAPAKKLNKKVKEAAEKKKPARSAKKK